MTCLTAPFQGEESKIAYSHSSLKDLSAQFMEENKIKQNKMNGKHEEKSHRSLLLSELKYICFRRKAKITLVPSSRMDNAEKQWYTV